MKKYAIFAFLWSEKNEKQQLQYLKIISLSNYLPVPVLRYGSKVPYIPVPYILKCM